MSRARLYGLDASIYIFKAWFGRDAQFFSAEGYPLNAVEGYLQSLLRALDLYRPQYILAAFDESLGQGFREALYPAYKSRRGLPDEALAYQLSACRNITAALGVYDWASTQFEADDLLASAAEEARGLGRAVTVLSRDKDLAQLLDDVDDCLHDLGEPPLNKAAWEEKSGIGSEQLADYLALIGDKVDDIPGVAGIGPVAAKAMLGKYRNLEAVFTHLDELDALPCRGAGKLAERLMTQRDEVFLFRELCTLRRDVPFLSDWKQAVYNGSRRQDFLATGLEIGLPAHWLESLCQRYSRVFT